LLSEVQAMIAIFSSKYCRFQGRFVHALEPERSFKGRNLISGALLRQAQDGEAGYD
jgi:hypothetical protein